ncbi:diacylglycerol kinase epsilon-like [Mya arenaria]|uniref:diacylglycerol kinase epsilon-like n=1 Tax=Mya arenaria TaxID=6604 RepID=UPI0022E62B87|nr:diacylglycerol kinase epsilon-like [Mya arenaria]XP_052791018.1 diacylglycerol kinase epsilon-like [Mya arenaria]
MTAPLLVGAIFVVIFIMMQMYKRYRRMHYDVLVWDVTKGHRWSMMDVFTEPTFCNVGNFSIKHGAKCSSCGICVDDSNMREANKRMPCKPLSIKGEGTQHQWIKGNLQGCSLCCICGTECGRLPQICDRKCVWCKRVVHDDCNSNGKFCDFGIYRPVIMPPHCVELKRVGIKGRRHLIVSKARSPNFENWKPLIVLGNRKSGNMEGEVVLSEFRDLLNPAQVVDLHDMQPENALEWCHLLPDTVFRLIVCGGDGTVGWVLNAIENLKLQTLPEIGILPLGTGNDLARVLGWGEGHNTDDGIDHIVQDVITAKPVYLDRWKININHKKHLGIARPKKEMIMNNYVSIGVDALVTLNFHKSRKSWPWLFANRLINKACYLTYGTKDVLERECKNLNEKVKVELDGEEIKLDNIEGLVVLNIASWGGGCRPWELSDSKDDYNPARYDDGLLEVMALYSSFHIAQIQVGLAAPILLGQARHVKITLKDSNAPMQCDGEPWEQHPAEININFHRRATMLSPALTETD